MAKYASVNLLHCSSYRIELNIHFCIIADNNDDRWRLHDFMCAQILLNWISTETWTESHRGSPLKDKSAFLKTLLKNFFVTKQRRSTKLTKKLNIQTKNFFGALFLLTIPMQ